MPADKLNILKANIDHYLISSTVTQRKISKVVSKYAEKSIIDIPASCGATECPLTRYPILTLRDKTSTQLYKLLSKRGLGASRLYKKILPKIEGVDRTICLSGQYPNAASFANRLITLPTHLYVHEGEIRALDEILRRYTY